MFKIKIFVDRPCKESWLKEALLEYEKRLKPYSLIEWKSWEDLSLEKEWIALDIQGDMLDSVALSKKLLSFGARLNFVIGGPEGIPQEILTKAKWRLSFSRLTFTNQMARILLLEQIYRSFEIDRNSPYHK